MNQPTNPSAAGAQAPAIQRLIEKWKNYQSQPVRYFNAPSAETLAFNERCTHRENKLIDVFLEDLAVLAALPSSRECPDPLCEGSPYGCPRCGKPSAALPSSGGEQGWLPIATAPKDGTWFLGWSRDIEYVVMRMGHGFLPEEEPDPTHWQPLPAPPSADNEVNR